VRLQLHALAYNLANFLRTLALPADVEHWSLTTLREKLVKIGARIVRHGRYVVFQLAEVAGAASAVGRDPPSDRSAQVEATPDMMVRPSTLASPQQMCGRQALVGAWAPPPRLRHAFGAPCITSLGPQLGCHEAPAGA
jgi:hypothetical protein